MEVNELFGLVFTIGMFSGVFLIFLAMRQRSEELERHHRERMAAIDRGQIPLPDQTVRRASGASAASNRALSLGIIVVGLGLGLMMIISVAAANADRRHRHRRCHRDPRRVVHRPQFRRPAGITEFVAPAAPSANRSLRPAPARASPPLSIS